MKLRWPRGRFNGQRIVGATVKVSFDLTWWSLGWPSFRSGTCLSLGPLHVWLGWAYD